jgi:hypothetical protein
LGKSCWHEHCAADGAAQGSRDYTIKSTHFSLLLFNRNPIGICCAYQDIGALTLSGWVSPERNSLSTTHPIDEFTQIQQFNRAIENITLLWLLRPLALIITGYV